MSIMCFLVILYANSIFIYSILYINIYIYTFMNNMIQKMLVRVGTSVSASLFLGRPVSGARGASGPLHQRLQEQWISRRPSHDGRAGV